MLRFFLSGLLFVLLLPQCLSASGKYPSPLPTPNAEVLNLEIEGCNTGCLRDLLENGQVFSFLAHINKDNQNKRLLEEATALLETLEISEIPYFFNLQKPFFNLALLFPRKSIGRYSSSTTNTILSYLLNQKARFNFEIFDSKTESPEDIQNALNEIQSKGYRQVIAILTQEGAKEIIQIAQDMSIFIPSVNQSQIALDGKIPENIIFGGISYERQIQQLSKLDSETKAASFYDGSAVGLQMQSYTEAINPNFGYSKSFNVKQNPNFAKEMKGLYGTLQGVRIFLNTPVANSSIILSQLTYNNIRPKGIYSTQINYNPSLLSITQERDRRNMYVANSIMPLDSLFVENASLLNADLEYNWINYATALGTEYFYLKNVRNAKRYFKERIQNQQVQYKIEILTPTQNRFAPFES